MRIAVLVVLAFAGMGFSQGSKPVARPVMPKLPPAEKAPVGSLSPAGQVRAAALDLSTRVAGRDRPFVRYISLYAAPAEKLPTWSVLLQVLLNTVSQGADIVRLAPVPDTGGRLFRVNIRAYRWTADAFSVVARRDPYFREPMIPHRETEFLRQAIGVDQDPKTFAAEAVVDGLFLMRDILQSDGRSDTYYDLLYAEQRFGAGIAKVAEVAIPADPGPEPKLTGGTPWPGGVWPDDGKYYKPGEFVVYKQQEIDAHQKALAAWQVLVDARQKAVSAVTQTKKPGSLKKNFPATLKEWEEFWGVEGAERFGRDRGFLVQKGEVVGGARNVKGGRGSFVAYNDRVIVVTRVPTGYHLETYDSFETKNDRDYIENPLNVVDGKINADAGELLVSLPNGLQAALLVNGKGERVEFADSRVARNSADAKDVTVRTQIGCLQCHAVDYGFISPTNRKVRESIEAGLKLNTLKEEDRDRIAAFFLDWEKKEAAIRSDMELAVRKATVANVLDQKDKGWTGSQIVAVMVDFRDWYDEPVTLEEASMHLGESKLITFMALTMSPTAGLNLAAVGKGMPRLAWDTTGAIEAGKLLVLLRVQMDIFTQLLWGIGI